MNLKLDWNLETEVERKKFIEDYISQYGEAAFTSSNLEMMANYILWGKDAQGQNAPARGIELPRRKPTWSPKPLDSLEELLESPTFSENQILSPCAPRYTYPKSTFSRTEALQYAPPYILSQLEALWSRIDELDYITSLYDLNSGKRKTPIREALESTFAPEERDRLSQIAFALSPRQYLQLRHELVEVRRQQYILRDSYSPQLLLRPTPMPQTPPLIPDHIHTLPLDWETPSPISSLIWNLDRFPIPTDFSEPQLSVLSAYIWRSSPSDSINFANPGHLRVLLDPSTDTPFKFKLPLTTYISLAPLKPHLRLILDLRLQGLTNAAIADQVNAQFNSNYSLHYISTLYHNTIIPLISETATQHRLTLENIFFPENFKECSKCGRVLLENSYNFARRGAGYGGTCASCRKSSAARSRRD